MAVLLYEDGLTLQNFIALFVHSTFTVHCQNTIHSGYCLTANKAKNALHNEKVILNYIGGDPMNLSLSN